MRTEFLIFSTADCKPCANLKKWIDTTGVKYRVVDVMDDLDTTNRYRVRGVPTMVRLDDGIETGRMVNYQPAEAKKLVDLQRELFR